MPAWPSDSPILGHTLLFVSSQGERGWGSLWALFYKALILFIRAPSFWPKHLPKSPPLNSIALDIRISTYELRGVGWGTHTNIQTIVLIELASRVLHFSFFSL